VVDALSGSTPMRGSQSVAGATARAASHIIFRTVSSKLYGIHSGKTVFSRDVKFDERTPVAPLIEGETSKSGCDAGGVGNALDGGGTTGEKTGDGGALSGRSLSECRLLGYCEPKQHKLYGIHSGKTVFSRDVKFDEVASAMR
jgi:hypothetical protein